MKRLFGKEARHRAYEYWKQLMHSANQKLSRGALYISKIITSAHKDGWRRKQDRHHKEK